MDAKTRLVLSLVVGTVAFGAAVTLVPWQVSALLGWDATAITFLAAATLAIRRKDASATRAIATREDDSRAAADVVLLGASLASLAGVVFALVKAAAEEGLPHKLILAVAILSVVLSWTTVHTVFLLRYARLFYAERGGIDFHDDRRPDFGDFGYFAFTIGMTFQVSDTDITSKEIRMTALRHSLLSYLFGVAVVAMTINVVAGLLVK